MQRLTEVDQKRQQCHNSRSRGIVTTNNHVFNESAPANLIENLKLEFPRFQREDPTYWIYQVNQFFSYNKTPEHQ